MLVSAVPAAGRVAHSFEAERSQFGKRRDIRGRVGSCAGEAMRGMLPVLVLASGLDAVEELEHGISLIDSLLAVQRTAG